MASRTKTQIGWNSTTKTFTKRQGAKERHVGLVTARRIWNEGSGNWSQAAYQNMSEIALHGSQAWEEKHGTALL